MPSTFYIETTCLLSQTKLSEITALTNACCIHDQLALSYPLSEEDTTHYLCYTNDDRLCAVLAMTDFYEGYGSHEDLGSLEARETCEVQEIAYAECIAFTLPEYRRQGCFSKLLEEAAASREDCDILMVVSGECDDTRATLEALGVELESEELQMELNLQLELDLQDDKTPGSSSETAACDESATRSTYTLTASAPAQASAAESEDSSDTESDPQTTLWTLTKTSSDSSTVQTSFTNFSTQTILGSCQTTRISDDVLCLHHVEILPEFRSQGYGTRLMQLLLTQLAKSVTAPHNAPRTAPQTAPLTAPLAAPPAAPSAAPSAAPQTDAPAAPNSAVRRIILQVSGDNTTAISLYKKTGFRITETLSYYLY